MSITGDTTISIRKRDLEGSKSIAVAFKKLAFAHKASAGDTGIDIGSLTTPTEMSSAGFLQPSSAELAAAKLLFNRKNLTLISSSKGKLLDFLSYRITSNSRISFEGFTADEDEIFIGIIDHEPQIGMLAVDASPMQPATGILSSGTTTINVGEAFEVNKYPTKQLGDVLVIVDGQVLLRNTGNVTAAPGADGDYQEIDNGSGLGSVIELNESKAFDRSYIVMSNGIRVNRPSASRDQTIETLAGQVDAMIPVLADAAGVPENTFQAAPNNVDLKSFGDRFSRVERYRLVDSAETALGPVDRMLTDTSGGAFTVDLPSVAHTGDWVEIWDAEGTFASFNLTVGRNGHLIEGAADDYVEDRDNARIKLVYVNSTRGWILADLS